MLYAVQIFPKHDTPNTQYSEHRVSEIEHVRDKIDNNNEYFSTHKKKKLFEKDRQIVEWTPSVNSALTLVLHIVVLLLLHTHTHTHEGNHSVCLSE